MIVVPKNVQEIYAESSFLRLCVVRPGVTRYWERVSKRESYMLFLRQKSEPGKPFYLIEIEPSGTIRQKRSFDDLQYGDIKETSEFLKEWQKAIQERMTSDDLKLAKKSKDHRNNEMDELRKNKTIVRTGYLTGKLLADVLDADLMEVEVESDSSETKEIAKVG